MPNRFYQTILRHIAHPHYRPVHSKTVMATLGIAPSEQAIFQRAIRDLHREKKISHTNR